jgi:hypothetical protein
MADVVNKFRGVVRAALGLGGDPGSPPDLVRLGLYRARVDAAKSDGTTLDVTPEDKRISPAQGVPVRVGTPGSTPVVKPGAIVLLGWVGGDPSKPYCTPHWEMDASTVQSLSWANANGDSITIANGHVTIKVGNTTVLDASATTLALGLLGNLAVLVQGSLDSMGVPVTQAPPASATIVKGG